MANTQFIKQTIEPFMREWLAVQHPGSVFEEHSVALPNGAFKFDAVSADGSVVALFTCTRPRTSTGNVNTGGVRKLLNDLHYLSLQASATKVVVFTDNGFLELMRRRSARIARGHVKVPIRGHEKSPPLVP